MFALIRGVGAQPFIIYILYIIYTLYIRTWI